MKIIGVSGGSGSGKSTVSKRLAETLPNAVRIDVDKFMHRVSADMEKEILKAVGVEDPKGLFSYNYYFKSYENTEIWFNKVKGPVNAMLEEALKGFEDKDYIVADWVFLPVCDFFKKCDYTLCVKTDSNITEERLIERLKNTNIYKKDEDRSFGSYKSWAIHNRVHFTALNKFGYKSQYEIKNDGELEDLYTNIDNFAKEVMESKPISNCYKFIEL